MDVTGSLFHLGFAVPSLDDAMASLGAALGVAWADPRDRTHCSMLADGTAMDHPYRVVYSRTGPPYVELLEGPPGSIWDAHGRVRLHHIGRWSTDLAADSAALAQSGHALVAHGIDEHGALARYTYHDLQPDLLLELVDPSRRAAWAKWVGAS